MALRHALFGLALTALPAGACEVALLLAVDVSNSVDPGEYRLQMDGIAAALRDPVVAEALVQGAGRIALLQWSGTGMQALSIPWTQVAAEADIARLADTAETLPRAFTGANTAVGEALAAAVDLAAAQADCRRRIVDVSGDGADNAGTDPVRARARARALGVTVNALAIEGLGPAITTYYSRAVITPDGFVETARGFTDFARAIRAKIRREVARVML